MLLRHGRTPTNVAGVLAGWSDVELDEVGVDQAAAVADRLAGVPLAAMVSSPLRRCQQTARSVAARHPELTVTSEDGLGECRYGDWQGRKLSELTDEPQWPVVQYHPSAAVFPGEGGEPLAVTAGRAVAAVRDWDARVAAEHGADAVWLACSHGDVIKAVVADALGLHLDLFQRIVVDPCAVTVIRYTPLRPFLVRLNDTGGDLGSLGRVPETGSDSSDAAVGGGTGAPAV
ncbi:MAG: histidine phosphatase family protein [Micromonosporaceae bacterium]